MIVHLRVIFTSTVMKSNQRLDELPFTELYGEKGKFSTHCISRSRTVMGFIPLYPNTLSVPKPSRASRMASLIATNLEASQSAITRL